MFVFFEKSRFFVLDVLAVLVVVALLGACGDDTRTAVDTGVGDGSAADTGARDAAGDAASDAGCIAASARCDRGDTCCGDLVCREASTGDGYCVEVDDTCLVGAETGCCLDDADCAGGASCYAAECRLMGDGVCQDPPAAGECWADGDCAVGMTCTGASICGCGVMCDSPDAPGTCG
ncbi:MAG: hypothetical protein DRJ42_14025 [Deltaproteobacteria bacterium]|nr:MAG: hypothetical protein DRJ42_14025 [Deltaproteobacteria bacterium]